MRIILEFMSSLDAALVSHVMCCFDRCKGNPRNLKYGVFGTLDVSFDYLIGKVAIIFIMYAPAAQILTRIKSGLDWVFSVNQSRCVPFFLFIKVQTAVIFEGDIFR